MEKINSVLINDGMPQGERLVKLNQIAIQQMQVLEDNEDNAVKMVRRMYRNCELVLDASDYEETEIAIPVFATFTSFFQKMMLFELFFIYLHRQVYGLTLCQLETGNIFLLKFPVESPPRKGKRANNLNVLGVRTLSVSSP